MTAPGRDLPRPHGPHPASRSATVSKRPRRAATGARSRRARRHHRAPRLTAAAGLRQATSRRTADEGFVRSGGRQRASAVVNEAVAPGRDIAIGTSSTKSAIRRGSGRAQAWPRRPVSSGAGDSGGVRAVKRCERDGCPGHPLGGGLVGPGARRVSGHKACATSSSAIGSGIERGRGCAGASVRTAAPILHTRGSALRA
jgi:hypothetical protein